MIYTQGRRPRMLWVESFRHPSASHAGCSTELLLIQLKMLKLKMRRDHADRQSRDYLELLSDGLRYISDAPLKPQQRLKILRVKMLPKITHKLVLAKLRLGLLVCMDMVMRRCVPIWVHLPHSTSVAFYHATTDWGAWVSCRLRIQSPSCDSGGSGSSLALTTMA